jgi:hypothetical protein
MSIVFAAALVRILFVGNSLTAANDLAGRVEALARGSGDEVQCVTLALPNFSLEDHWNQGDAARVIAKGGWTFVVLQQGPSALPESRVLLVEYTRRFDRLIRQTGARTALYMVWPSEERRNDFAGVIRSYAAAAKAVDGILLPVGAAWRAAWQVDPAMPLYGDDRFHPTAVASSLAAVVIYERLRSKIVTRLPDVWRLTAAQRNVIMRAAAAVRPATTPSGS